MKLKKAFSADLKEAFEYFKSKQLEATQDPAAIVQVQAITLEAWVSNMLRKPVYELIGEKRANVDE